MHYADLKPSSKPVEIDHVTTKIIQQRYYKIFVYRFQLKLLEILHRSSTRVYRQRLRLRSRSIHVDPIAYISACRYGSGNYIGPNDPWIIAGVTSTCE